MLDATVQRIHVLADSNIYAYIHLYMYAIHMHMYICNINSSGYHGKYIHTPHSNFCLNMLTIFAFIRKWQFFFNTLPYSYLLRFKPMYFCKLPQGVSNSLKSLVWSQLTRLYTTCSLYKNRLHLLLFHCSHWNNLCDITFQNRNILENPGKR